MHADTEDVTFPQKEEKVANWQLWFAKTVRFSAFSAFFSMENLPTQRAEKPDAARGVGQRRTRHLETPSAAIPKTAFYASFFSTVQSNKKKEETKTT